MEPNEQVESRETHAPARKALGRLLEEAGLATHEQVRQAAEEAAQRGERFGEVLLRRGYVQERDLARLMAEQWEIPFVDDPAPDPSAAALLSAEQARAAAALPLKVEAGRALVAIADPSTERFAQVRGVVAGGDVDFAVVTQTALEAHLAAPAGPAAPALEPLLAEVAAARESLRAVAATLERVGEALLAAVGQGAALQETGRKLDELERRLDSVLAAQEDERARASRLEAELAKRNDLFTELRTKLGDLTGALEAGGGTPAA